MTTPTLPDGARCRGCGYPLHALPDARRCPECGRPFDPADPTTVDVGRRPGPVGRLLLRPIGWPLAIVAVVAASAVAVATRWSAGGVRRPIASDLLYYFPHGRFRRDLLLSATDWAYVGGLGLMSLVLLAGTARAVARPLARRRYRRPPPPTDVRRRAALAAVATVAVVVAGGGVLIGWPYRLARIWAKHLLAAVRRPTSPYGFTPPPVVPPPLPLTDGQQLEVLKTGILRLPTTAERTACLRLLTETVPAPAVLPTLLDLMPRQTDPAVRATLAHLVGLYRDPATLGPLLAQWDDPDPDVRAAVTDAVGILHAQAYPIPNQTTSINSYPPLDVGLRTDPPIQPPQVHLDDQGVIGEPGRHRSWGEYDHLAPVRDLPGNAGGQIEPVRPRVVDRMLHGSSDAERQAAARALLRWPPPAYHLRVAEWGVWVADRTGGLVLLKSLIDEVPPFVHRTGNPLAEFDDRLNGFFVVDKPILHVTSDVPLAMDVQVLIAAGRPWFAYPRPDDFTLTTIVASPVETPIPNQPAAWNVSRPPPPPVARFDQPTWPPLADAREGYPWIDPPHRLTGAVGAPIDMALHQVTGVGLRWQSVIVSPDRLPWMAPPAVPVDPKFAWWDRLRQVDCSWVSSNSESDRFLYYDGPTTATAPVTVTLDGDHLRFARPTPPTRTGDPRGDDQSFAPLRTPADAAQRHRRGLFIRMENDHPTATPMPAVESSEAVQLTRPFPLAGEPAVAAALHGLLTAAGLTAAEAAGLVDCWRPQLFRTPGSRFLLLMTPADYDALCPIRIDPPPTQLVRVGLVLTEFGPAVTA